MVGNCVCSRGGIEVPHFTLVCCVEGHPTNMVFLRPKVSPRSRHVPNSIPDARVS